MKVLFLLSLCLSLAAVSAIELKVVKPTRMKQFLASSDAIVLYCGGSTHCPFVKTLISKLDLSRYDVEGDVVATTFDAVTYNTVAATLGYHGGDTIIFYQHGKVHDVIPIYLIHNMQQIGEWISRSSQDLLTEIHSVQEFNEETQECAGEYSTIVLFSTNEHHAIEKKLLQFHLKYDMIFQVRAIRDANLMKQVGGEDETVKVYQCFDHKMTKEFTRAVDDDLDGMTSWALHRGTPLVMPITEASLLRSVTAFDWGIVVAVPDGQEEKIVPMLTRIAKKTNVGFVWGSADKLKRRLQDSGASGKVFPTAMAMKTLKELPMSWDEGKKFTEKNLLIWVQQLEAGTAEPFRKSAPIPPVSSGPVQELVFDNFAFTVANEKTNSLVMFTGAFSKCPSCYSTQYVYRELAEVFSGRVSFYEYNIDDNYITQPISRVPDIFLYMASGDVIRYPDETVSKSHLEKWLKAQFPTKHDEL